MTAYLLLGFLLLWVPGSLGLNGELSQLGFLRFHLKLIRILHSPSKYFPLSLVVIMVMCIITIKYENGTHSCGIDNKIIFTFK